MYTSSQIENFLFLDIETASLTDTYEHLPERLKAHWDRKSGLLQSKSAEQVSPEEYFPMRAAIYSEFGKVVSISCGVIKFRGEEPVLRMKSYFGPDEKATLEGFAQMMDGFRRKLAESRRELVLCAHNGKEFDFPYLGRRFVINGLPVPEPLQVQGKKPWEVNFADTMELWKFGDYKSFTSLDLLTAILEIPSPKDEMDGSEVGRVFWQEKNYEKIRKYCEKDVVATAQVILKFSRLPLVAEANIEYA